MLSDEREPWQVLDALLQTLLDLDSGERERWLEQHAVQAPDQARDLRRLLQQAETGGLLSDVRSQSLVRDAWVSVGGIGVGSMLGEWTLLAAIGAGGMAQVFLAERVRGDVVQRAALKLLAAHLKTKGLVARFIAEQGMLARLSDARIARYYDGGIAPDGRPWMAMEYVAGTPIDVYCRERELNARQRLQLFRSVTGAVAHAHRHLIVHRDIKPSNVLVDHDGQVKLIDFGIAKPLDAEDGHLTASGVRPLTPRYASPEQLRGEPTATSSDVFQAGLLLFELLTGERPFAAYEQDPFALEQALRELDPPRPSEVLAERARVRQSKPQSSDRESVSSLMERARSLRGDLDHIALMALRKDPAQRYLSMEQLDEDIAHVLAGEPVRARAASWVYRIAKWARRHRFVSGASLAALLVAALAATALVQQNRLVRHERDNARLEASKASATKQFLLDLIADADPARALGERLELGTVLARGGKRIEAAFETQPELRADLLQTLSSVYRGLGNYAEARRLIVQAIALHESLPEAAAATSRALSLQSAIERDDGQLEAALTLAREALGLAGTDARAQALAWYELGIAELMHEGGNYRQAGDALQQSIEAHRRAPELDTLAVAIAQANLAILDFREARFEQAERGYRRAIDVLAPRLGDNHPEVSAALYNLARLQEQQERWSEAESTLRRVLAAESEVLGEEHPDVAISRSRLGFVLLGRGDVAAARDSFAQALAVLRKALPSNHKRIAENLMGYSEAALLLGDLPQAEALIRESLSILNEHFPADDWRVAEASRVQARVWIRNGRRDDARLQLQRIGPALLAQPEPYPRRYRIALSEL